MDNKIISKLFKENVNNINKITFSRHAFMSEEGFDCRYTIDLEYGEFENNFTDEIEECHLNETEILEIIRNIEMWNWKTKYETDIYDGEMWEIEIWFNNAYMIRYSGHGEYPKGYNRFIKIFGL